ncbi:hypothetical protein D9M68_807570 [compost metagenome]
MVALSRYDEITEDFIEATVDLNEWKQLGHEQLDVHISRFPEFCKLVKITPSKINFIIEK